MDQPIPRWMIRLLRGFCHADYLDEVQGDLEEMYYLRLGRMSVFQARLLLLKEVLGSFKTYVINGDKNSYPSNNQSIMFRNYFTIAIRNLQKYRLYSFINILGLSIGLACSVLILLYVANELSYDQYHEQADRIYRITETLRDEGGEVTEYSASVPWSVGPTLKNDFPSLTVTRMYQAWQKEPLISTMDKESNFYEDNLFFVDSSFFNTFSFKVIRGKKESALQKPQSAVLTESTAMRYFGTTDVLGKSLLLENDLQLTMTAVTEDVPPNSHFHYDLLVPLLNIGDIFKATGNNWSYTGWYWNPVHTYVVLPERFDKSQLEAHFPGFVKDHFPASVVDGSGLELQAMTDIHFDTEHYQQIEAGVSKSSIYIAAAIALFILLIAAINFINLSTATATKRAKEVGIRKVMGSTRYSLVMQFYGEAILFCLLSLLLAIVLINFLVPPFESLVSSTLNFDYLVTWQTVLLTLAGTVLLGVLAGTYPAFQLSRFQPAAVLKAVRPTGRGGVNYLRKGLVVFQFIISVMLLFSAAVVYLQHNYLTSKELGFAREQIIMFPIRGTSVLEDRQLFKNRLAENPQSIAATVTSDIVGQDVPLRGFGVKGYEEPQNLPGLFTDRDFVKTFGIKVVAGRDFDKENVSDRRNFLINQAMLDRMKDKDWEGQSIDWDSEDSKIIGMVEDFNFMSLKNEIRPLLIGVSDGFLGYMAVRVREGNIYETIDALEATWKEFEPDKPFMPFFLDEKLNQLYQSEERTTEIITYFSSLAIFIAFLGLVGLVTYRVNTRVHEIGIRKILGATDRGIFRLLSKEFLWLIIIANLIALPLGWYLMDGWLQNFAYRINIPWWLFLVAGLIVLLVAAITSLSRSYAAIRMNPVDTLKDH